MNICSHCRALFYYSLFNLNGDDVCEQCYDIGIKPKQPPSLCSCGADKAGVSEWGHSRWCSKSDRYEEYITIQKMKEEEDNAK